MAMKAPSEFAITSPRNPMEHTLDESYDFWEENCDRDQFENVLNQNF